MRVSPNELLARAVEAALAGKQKALSALGHMLPVSSLQQATQVGLADLQLTREGSSKRPGRQPALSVRLTNTCDDILGKRRAGVCASLKASAPTDRSSLRHHISRVIGPCTKKKVRRVAAHRVVAVMQYTQTMITVCERPRYSMCVKYLTTGREQRKPSVVVSSRTQPNPTGSEFGPNDWSVFIDLAPEPCNVFFVHGNLLPVGHVPGRVVATRGHCVSSTGYLP